MPAARPYPLLFRTPPSPDGLFCPGRDTMSSHGNSLFLRESGQRLGGVGCLQSFQDSLQQRALRTRLRLQTMTREHVRRFLRRNAFILLTVSAVIIGELCFREAGLPLTSPPHLPAVHSSNKSPAPQRTQVERVHTQANTAV